MDLVERLRVFVSYARLDGAELAEELTSGLQLLGFTPTLDKRDIAAAEDWEQRLDALIRQADTVVFLLSPRSVQSPRCAWEVERAVALSKRIVPIVALPVAEAEVPEPLRKLNFIDFGPGQSYSRALGRLADALRVDLEWIREHSRLADLAARWIARDRDEALLLRGAELGAAQGWEGRWHSGAPPPTDSHRAYVVASTEAAALRDSTERQRLEDMAQANASRAEALSMREAAVRSLRRRTLIGGTAAGVLSVGVSTLGILYARERKRADEADAQSIRDQAKREALRTDLQGQVVAYAASPGQYAMDASGFTKGLLDQLASEQVPLGVALSRTVRTVIDTTKGAQRPYIASDMNGDVYFRSAPPTRQRRALVITVDTVGELDLPGVRADGAAWNGFFKDCTFEVQWLRNPKRDDVIAALYNARTASVSVPASMFRSVGAGVTPPKSEASGASRADPPKTPANPAPNTFFALYFAGDGFRLDDFEYIAMTDSPLHERASRPNDDAIRATAVKVNDMKNLLREHFAASCLIFDTHFRVLRTS